MFPCTNLVLLLHITFIAFIYIYHYFSGEDKILYEDPDRGIISMEKFFAKNVQPTIDAPAPSSSAARKKDAGASV